MQRRFLNQAEKRKRARQAAREEKDRRYQARMKDVKYYINRSDLPIKTIADSIGVSYLWLFKLYHDELKYPNDDWMQNVIDFVKHFEQLQAYYITQTQNTRKVA